MAEMKLVSAEPPNLPGLFVFIAHITLLVCMNWLLSGGRDSFLSFNGGVCCLLAA